MASRPQLMRTRKRLRNSRLDYIPTAGLRAIGFVSTDTGTSEALDSETRILLAPL
jgi:hypothetical protein